MNVNTWKELSGSYKQCTHKGGVLLTYFVGIDIAKFKHDCFIMNHDGEIIKKSFSFNNDKTGFHQLLSTLSNLPSNNEVRIGLEATAHYAANLKLFLEVNNFSFMELHPIFIKRFISATTLRRTKTDKIDASVISWYLSTVDYKPYPSKSYHITSLKSLTRLRYSLMEERTRHLVRITNILDLVFPEFKPFFANKLTGASCLYILQVYSVPSKISRMNQDSYDKMKRKLRHPISYARFLHLKQLAIDTIGHEDNILTFQLLSLLDLFKMVVAKISNIDSLIRDELSHVDTMIPSIVGIGDISAASIIAEVGNFDFFDSADQLLAFAGLEPSVIQSGEASRPGKMVKHGSPHLRRTILNCASFSIIHIPAFYDYYLKKRSEGKPHRVALSHLAKKLVRVIFYLEKNHIPFDISKLR